MVLQRDEQRHCYLLDLQEGLVGVLVEVPNLARVYAHDTQHELAREAQREGCLWVDDGIWGAAVAVGG